MSSWCQVVAVPLFSELLPAETRIPPSEPRDSTEKRGRSRPTTPTHMKGPDMSDHPVIVFEKPEIA